MRNQYSNDRRYDAVFSDEEVKRIKEIFDERQEALAGRIFIRFLLRTAWAALAGATTAAIAYFEFKK